MTSLSPWASTASAKRTDQDGQDGALTTPDAGGGIRSGPVRRPQLDVIEHIDFYAGSNILDPIRYDVAENCLQAKFSMAALIAMLVLFRRAGLPEFEDDVVRSERFPGHAATHP